MKIHCHEGRKGRRPGINGRMNSGRENKKLRAAFEAQGDTIRIASVVRELKALSPSQD